ncbi:MAG: response regulator, partial [Gemmataceae bacterium]
MNILVVDDENTLRRMIRITLESQGHAVTEAATGASAVERVRAARPDLVLLDLKLGRESGLNVLSELHQAGPGGGVVVITAHATIETAVEPIRRGALDYLPKPFTPQQLADLLAK